MYLHCFIDAFTGTVFRRLIFAVVSIIFMPLSVAFAAPQYALWVEVEGVNRPFDTAQGFEQFRQFSDGKGFTDLYCQVYRGGRSWFPSKHADEAPYRQSLSQGVDPLKDTLRLAHSRGQKVHAWINSLRVAHNKYAPLVAKLGKEAVLVDSHGKSLLDYPEDGKPPGPAGHYFQLDTPAYWLDPSHPGVRQYVLDTIEELVIAYPQLDGIHLDMTRFPFAMRSNRSQNYKAGLWFGYSNTALSRFYEEQSVIGDQLPMPTLAQFQNWQRSQITQFVRDLRAMLKRRNPKLELSAAVLAWPDRAQDYALQDWVTWVEQGLIDTIMPMSYTRDVETIRRHTQYAMQKAKPSNTKVVMGLGAWLLLSRPEVAVQQTSIAIGSGAAGVNLFSYSNLLTKQGQELAVQVQRELKGKR